MFNIQLGAPVIGIYLESLHHRPLGKGGLVNALHPT
jgi:hypothetical protein